MNLPERRFRKDTEELPADIGDELRRMLVEARFFEIDERQVVPSEPGPPDVFRYRLTIQEGQRRKTLSFNDTTAPRELNALLGLLRTLALQARKGGG